MFPMFFVKDERDGVTYLVYTLEDPRKEGYRGQVAEGVRLDYDAEAVYTWEEGQERPEVCVGREPTSPNHHKVFKYGKELQAEGYQPVPGTPVVFGSWSEYTRLHLIPPDPEQTDDEHWYDYLDKLDDVSRRRRQRAPAADRPAGSSRDEVAAWVARKHLVADSSIRQVWYLPQGAPPEEIRLLEVNDRNARGPEKIEAIDFGLDVEGVPFRLVVADVTSEELQHLQRDPAPLPPGWALDGAAVWGRRR
jgi:hypothetical protein